MGNLRLPRMEMILPKVGTQTLEISNMQISRRNMIAGLASVVVAPSIVRIENVMPVRSFTDFYLELADGLDNHIISSAWFRRDTLENWEYLYAEPGRYFSNGLEILRPLSAIERSAFAAIHEHCKKRQSIPS